MDNKQTNESKFKHDIGEDTIIIIKLKKDVKVLDAFRSDLLKSQSGEPAEYRIKESGADPNTAILLSKYNNKEYRCVLFDFDSKAEKGEELKQLYWAKSSISDDNSTIVCDLLYYTNSKNVITSFASSIAFDLFADFTPYSYLTYENSKYILKQMHLLEKANLNSLLNTIYEQEQIVQSGSDKIEELEGRLSKQKSMLKTDQQSKPIKYTIFNGEKKLSPLAQRNEYCRREHNIRFADPERGEFQRDYDRILYSKAFRRMVDKAQIFSSTKGDHYRTRMTHTLMVCQIARSISIRLNLNRALTEAIAIGHDLGHTPFGHQGERTLDNILKGEGDFLVEGLEIDGTCQYGGFKHNFQGVRVATCLEDAYFGIQGMDLSLQTLDGIWKHTDTDKGQEISQFTTYRELFENDSKYPITLEGQVVALADEIAQRSHDIDDALSSSLISFEELAELLKLTKFEKITTIVESLENKSKDELYTSDRKELLYTRLSAGIVSFFINDVVACSDQAMKKEIKERKKDTREDVFFHEQLIDFSPIGKRLSGHIENILKKKVLNSVEVVLFDDNASNIVYSLFKIYYKNPMLLHDGTLRRLYKYYLDNGIKDVFEFRESQPKLMNQEWSRITSNPIKCDDVNNREMIIKKRKLLVRTICDYIAGMTDSYAIKEYEKHYKR